MDSLTVGQKAFIANEYMTQAARWVRAVAHAVGRPVPEKEKVEAPPASLWDRLPTTPEAPPCRRVNQSACHR